ncbi:hypothetical protein F2Q70_00014347 [Brassica cretica]|uniref:Uncharacterized protein n=1 Tax=Brassica cretica TaxID=69181 RepID=A0A3N6QZ15_BRACR|nr:hypothetical protein F2Q70_00014347 [Brassica cretica]
MNFLNSAASICRRVSLRELITEVPAYNGSGITDASSSGLSVGLLRKPLVPPRTVVTLNPRISASRSSEER